MEATAEHAVAPPGGGSSSSTSRSPRVPASRTLRFLPLPAIAAPTVTVPTPAGQSSTGTPWVAPTDIGHGVGPTATPERTLVGDLTIDVPGTTVHNTLIEGCVTVTARGVTLDGVEVRCDSWYPIHVIGVGGFTLIRSRIDCGGRPEKALYAEDAGDLRVEASEIVACDDGLYIDGGNGTRILRHSVIHHQAPTADAHTDGIQLGVFEPTSGELVVEGNWFAHDGGRCCANAVVFLSSTAAVDATIRANHLDADFGLHLIRCNRASRCVVEDNAVDGRPGSTVVHAPGAAGHARCNVD
ncbi:MAG: hypothetical protein D6683_15395, partial [Actinomyces sp.]